MAVRVPVLLDTAVRTGSDYGVEVSVSDATQLAQVLSSEVTLWGVPGVESHDQSRGWSCIQNGEYVNKQKPCTPPNPRSTAAFLTMPTACAGPLIPFRQRQIVASQTPEKGVTEMPSRWKRARRSPASKAAERCRSTLYQAETSEPMPAPRPGSKSTFTYRRTQRAERRQARQSAVKATTIDAPGEAVQLNPSAANGLEACSERSDRLRGSRRRRSTLARHRRTAAFLQLSPGPDGKQVLTGTAPNASKVGTVKIKTPLLPNELEGAAYLAAQNANPFGSLVAMYIVAEDPVSGVLVKLAGEGASR